MLKILLLFILVFVSCGKKSSSHHRQEEQDESEAIYYGKIYPLNSSGVSGHVQFTKAGDDLQAEVRLRNAPSVTHLQYLHTSHYCPITDYNGDGFFDAKDIQKESGERLLPLDADLSGVELGNDSFPSGSYLYHQTTSYYLMQSDLVHLELLQGPLSFENRSVVIYGVSKSRDLPASVSALPGLSVHESLPIGCASLEKVSEVPSDDPVPTRAPTVRREPKPEPVPEVIPEPSVRRSWFERLTDRLKHWWCRVRGRCS